MISQVWNVRGGGAVFGANRVYSSKTSKPGGTVIEMITYSVLFLANHLNRTDESMSALLAGP